MEMKIYKNAPRNFTVLCFYFYFVLSEMISFSHADTNVTNSNSNLNETTTELATDTNTISTKVNQSATENTANQTTSGDPDALLLEVQDEETLQPEPEQFPNEKSAQAGVPTTRLNEKCDYQLWLQSVKPFWQFKIKNDWLALAKQDGEIKIAIQNDPSMWQSLCLHPSYFTFMECDKTTEVCKCHQGFKEFIAEENMCKVKKNGKCGSSIICSNALACVDGKCQKETNSGHQIIFQIQSLLIMLLIACSTCCT